MNERLARALEQRLVDTEQRRYLRAVRHDPIPFRERIEVAQALTEAKDHRLAALWYASAFRNAGEPRAPSTAYRLGNALRMARHDRAAAEVLEGVCAAQPEWSEPAHSLAWLYRNARQAAKAADVMERWLDAISPSTRQVRLAVGFMLEMGLVDRAEGALTRVPSPEPVLQTERARLLLNLGHFAEAERLLSASLERDPTQGDAWLRLAQVRRWASVEQSPLESMKAALRQPGIDDSMRAAIAFALVKVEDDLGLYEQAWTQALEANMLRQRSSRFNRTAWMRHESNILQTFTKEYLENNLNSASVSAPIFVVGMPRSGTTLLERRLGRHSRLQAVGELEAIESVAIELVGIQSYPRGLPALSAQDFAFGAQRWQELIPGGSKPGLEVVDKNPLNYMNIGFILKLFPRARIIHCRRAPLDTALSLWFQNFAHPRNDYAYNMADLAWVFGSYQRLMALWERVLPQQILTLDYETLVERPEETLRQLVADLGLDWEEALLESPGEGDGAIATASLWQARQPFYKHASGRARHYEPWIQPLRGALQREGVRV